MQLLVVKTAGRHLKLSLGMMAPPWTLHESIFVHRDADTTMILQGCLSHQFPTIGMQASRERSAGQPPRLWTG